MGLENLLRFMFSILPDIRLQKHNFSRLHFKNISQTLAYEKMHA